jgi:hypothetical protein
MTKWPHATELIGQLLDDPTDFFEKNAAYQLLQEYFHGYPVETLRPLLRDERVMVQRAATFVVNELGGKGCALISDVIPLIEASDRHVAYDALEIVAGCSAAGSRELFALVCRALARDDHALRGLAMRLMVRADDEMLRACLPLFVGQVDDAAGIDLLLRKRNVSVGSLTGLLDGPNPVARRYAAVAAVRSRDAFPEVIERLRSDADPDLRRLVEDMAETS